MFLQDSIILIWLPRVYSVLQRMADGPLCNNTITTNRFLYIFLFLYIMIIETRGYAFTQFHNIIYDFIGTIQNVWKITIAGLGRNAFYFYSFLPRLKPIDFVFGRIIGFYNCIYTYTLPTL